MSMLNLSFLTVSILTSCLLLGADVFAQTNDSCSIDNTPGIRFKGVVPVAWKTGKSVAWKTYAMQNISGFPAASSAACNCRCKDTPDCVAYLYWGKKCYYFSHLRWTMELKSLADVEADIPSEDEEGVLARVTLPGDNRTWQYCSDNFQEVLNDQIPVVTSDAKIAKQPAFGTAAGDCNAYCAADPYCLGFIYTIGEDTSTCTLLSDVRGPMVNSTGDTFVPLQTCFTPQNYTAPEMASRSYTPMQDHVEVNNGTFKFKLSNLYKECLAQLPSTGASANEPIYIGFETCDNTSATQIFNMEAQTDQPGRIRITVNTTGGGPQKCLTADAPKSGSLVVAQPCERLNMSQVWIPFHGPLVDDVPTYGVRLAADPFLVMSVSEDNYMRVFFDAVSDSQLFSYSGDAVLASYPPPPPHAPPPPPFPSPPMKDPQDKNKAIIIASAVAGAVAVIAAAVIAVVLIRMKKRRDAAREATIVLLNKEAHIPTVTAPHHVVVDCAPHNGIGKVQHSTDMSTQLVPEHHNETSSSYPGQQSQGSRDVTHASGQKSNTSGAGLCLKQQWVNPDNVYIKWSDLKVVKDIGHGGMGAVSVGTWKGNKVAIKKLHPGKATPVFMDSLFQEALLMRDLQHPCVARVYGLVNEDPHYALAMQYYKKGSLAAHMRTNDYHGLTLIDRLRLALQVASGMCYLHERQPPILHLDLKTSNILMDDMGGVVIADFGIAGCHGANAAQAVGALTVSISPPEVLIDPSAPRDETVDVYAFAIVLLEIVTGSSPYKGLREIDVAALVTSGRRPVIPGDVPLGVAKVIEECWSQDPAARPCFSAVSQKLLVGAQELAPECDMMDFTQTHTTTLY